MPRFLTILDSDGEMVLNADEFLLLERPLLRELLQRDTLRVFEPVVYGRLKKWAEHQIQESRRKSQIQR